MPTCRLSRTINPPLRLASAAKRATPTTSARKRGAVLRTRIERHVGADRGGSVGGLRGEMGIDKLFMCDEIGIGCNDVGGFDGKKPVVGMGSNGNCGLILGNLDILLM